MDPLIWQILISSNSTYFQPKSVLKNRKSEFDILEDDDTPHYESAEDTSQPSHIDLVIDSMNVSLSFA